MTQNPESKNRKRRPFKYTRQLIKLALDDGLTQTDISKLCRTHQSTVSSWKSGATLGKEGQLEPLLTKYGYKLRRHTFRLYWSLADGSDEKIYSKVEGKIIFSESFDDRRRDGAKLVKIIPTKRIVIHYQGNGFFRLIEQNRHTIRGHEEVESAHDDANWNSQIHEQVELARLLKVLDEFGEKIRPKWPSNAETLPFLIRKALLNHGFSFDGIVDYPEAW